MRDTQRTLPFESAATTTAPRPRAAPRPAGCAFVTFCLADALRASEHLRLRIESLRAANGRSEEAARRLRRAVEAHLDRGLGACLLRAAAVARIVEAVLLSAHPRRCALRAWSVLPNHVHALFAPAPGVRARDVVSYWKSHASRRVNAHLRREGALFGRDFFSRELRTPEELDRATRYVENDPALEGLVPRAAEWSASSARLRGADGALDATALQALADAARGSVAAASSSARAANRR